MGLWRYGVFEWNRKFSVLSFEQSKRNDSLTRIEVNYISANKNERSRRLAIMISQAIRTPISQTTRNFLREVLEDSNNHASIFWLRLKPETDLISRQMVFISKYNLVMGATSSYFFFSLSSVILSNQKFRDISFGSTATWTTSTSFNQNFDLFSMLASSVEFRSETTNRSHFVFTTAEESDEIF